jgi:hypothetical protein
VRPGEELVRAEVGKQQVWPTALRGGVVDLCAHHKELCESHSSLSNQISAQTGLSQDDPESLEPKQGTCAECRRRAGQGEVHNALELQMPPGYKRQESDRTPRKSRWPDRNTTAPFQPLTPTLSAVQAAKWDEGGPLSWDAIGERHPSLYGDSEVHGEAARGADGEGIGWAASHLAHSRPDDPEAEAHSVHDLDFHEEHVDPKHIDYFRNGRHDPRVIQARMGYDSSRPSKVPPLVLVHRHGVYQVADGHHRAEGAAIVGKKVRAYVAYSPYPDEPGADGEKAPYNGAQLHPGRKTASEVKTYYHGTANEADEDEGQGGHTLPAGTKLHPDVNAAWHHAIKHWNDDEETAFPRVYEVHRKTAEGGHEPHGSGIRLTRPAHSREVEHNPEMGHPEIKVEGEDRPVLYHGTTHYHEADDEDLSEHEPPHEITAGGGHPSFGPGVHDPSYAYATRLPSSAWTYAEERARNHGGGTPHVYRVAPKKPADLEEDPAYQNGYHRGVKWGDMRSKGGFDVLDEVPPSRAQHAQHQEDHRDEHGMGEDDDDRDDWDHLASRTAEMSEERKAEIMRIREERKKRRYPTADEARRNRDNAFSRFFTPIPEEELAAQRKAAEPKPERINDKTYSIDDVSKHYGWEGFDPYEIEHLVKKPEHAQFTHEDVPVHTLRHADMNGGLVKPPSYRSIADQDEDEKERLQGLEHGYDHGARIPPIVVVRHGGHHIIADGSHRAAIAADRGDTHIPAFVTERTVFPNKTTSRKTSSGCLVRHADGRQRYYHGTAEVFQPGDLLDPSYELGGRRGKSYAFVTTDLDAAHNYAKHKAWSKGMFDPSAGPHAYEVEPTGPVEKDDTVDNQFAAWRSRHPFRVVREVPSTARKKANYLPFPVIRGPNGEPDEYPGTGIKQVRHSKDMPVPLYHGTSSRFEPGDHIAPGHPGNFVRRMKHVYATESPEEAQRYGWHGLGQDWDKTQGNEQDRHPRVYEVRPTGPYGHRSDAKGSTWASEEPLEVVREVWHHEPKEEHIAMRKQAHDSGDGQRIFHCPFCGAGQVLARSDGTTECEFCHQAFTVQVQPQFSAFPQTDPVTGLPIQIPGMPGQIDAPGTLPGAPGAPPGMEGEDGSDNPFADDGGDEGAPEEGPDDSTEDSTDEDDNTPDFLKSKSSRSVFGAYRTANGDLLGEDAYVRHLALRYAPDPDKMIELLRGGR